MDEPVIGQEIEIAIEGITSKGEGVGRYQGLAVFVPFVLPKETAAVRIIDRQKNYARAELVRLLKGSNKRTPVPCPVFGECGGCALQHTSYENQLLLKQTIIADAMERIAKLDIAVALPLGTFDAYHYRNRIDYHVRIVDDMLQTGFYARNSRELIPAEGCLLAAPPIRELAKKATEVLHKYIDQLQGLRELVIRCNRAGDALLLTLVVDDPLTCGEEIAGELIAAENSLCSVWQCSGQAKHGIYGENWQLLTGEGYLVDGLLGKKWLLSPGSFSQVNHQQTEVLYQQIEGLAELDGSQTVLDLFCGAGTISLALADGAKEIIGVESYAPAMEDAKRNAELNQAYNCRFICEDAAKALPYLMAKGINADLVVLDPPRAGLRDRSPRCAAADEAKAHHLCFLRPGNSGAGSASIGRWRL